MVEKATGPSLGVRFFFRFSEVRARDDVRDKVQGSSQPQQTGSLRTLISLLIVVHLFFVFVSLHANYSRSQLLGRILRRFGFYTQLLNLDPDFKPYYLTHATEADVDHRIEILPVGEARWHTLAAQGWAAAAEHARLQRLAAAMAYVAEDESAAARLAQAVGEHVLHQRGLAPRQIRVRRHMLQDWEVIRSGTARERDPDSEVYFRTPYIVGCVVSGDGRVQVVRMAGTGEVAQPPERSPGGG
jgi:hypothetical protein